jgi:hypothetical protein
MLNGSYISAHDPEAVNHWHVGAWNENVRQENGRILLDKVIDIDYANKSDKGKEVLNAIEGGAPIHTSTGLTARLDNAEDDSHEYVARDIVFDHDAILIHEEGAATPERQGVGMMVNGQKVQVFNEEIDWTQYQLDWAVETAHDALDTGRKAPFLSASRRLLWKPIRQPPSRKQLSNNARRR